MMEEQECLRFFNSQNNFYKQQLKGNERLTLVFTILYKGFYWLLLIITAFALMSVFLEKSIAMFRK